MKLNANLVCATAVLALMASMTFVSGGGARARERAAGEKRGAKFVPGRVLVQFRAGVSADRAGELIAGARGRRAREITQLGVHVIELPAGAKEVAAARALGAQPEVEFAELDYVLPPQQMTPNDPYYENPNAWSLKKISGPGAWAMNTGSSQVVIAILDTGVDGTHEDLAAKMVPGWNVYNNNADTSDVRGHGTAVAGIAAAASNNSLGVASVAWGSLIMPVRITDGSGYASISDIADGLTWAADHGARIANISFNANGYSTVSSAARYFQNRGGVVAVAAGNDGLTVQGSDDQYILTVGATDQSDALYSWSNRGNNLDVVAPGNVATTGRGGGYVAGTGTSFAAPIVAAAAALVFSANPSLTPSQVQGVLKQSADDLGSPGWDSTYGYGRINLERALNSTPASGGSPDATTPSVVITSPPDGGVVSGMVSVQVSAADDVGVVKVELYVDGALVGASTNSPFTIKWNTRKAAKGAHALQAKAYDAAGNVGVSPTVTAYK